MAGNTLLNIKTGKRLLKISYLLQAENYCPEVCCRLRISQPFLLSANVAAVSFSKRVTYAVARTGVAAASGADTGAKIAVRNVSRFGRPFFICEVDGDTRPKLQAELYQTEILQTASIEFLRSRYIAGVVIATPAVNTANSSGKRSWRTRMSSSKNRFAYLSRKGKKLVRWPLRGAASHGRSPSLVSSCCVCSLKQLFLRGNWPCFLYFFESSQSRKNSP